MPVQTAFEARTHASFETLMWALAYPGRPQALALEPGQNPFLAVAEALLDLEVTAYAGDAALEPDLRRTGARLESFDRAEYLFLPSLETADLVDLQRARRGDALQPDTAATLFIGASFDSGLLQRWRGPGIDGSLELQIGGLPDAFWRLREQVISFPVGWDVVFIETSSARLVGLPRSTTLEVI